MWRSTFGGGLGRAGGAGAGVALPRRVAVAREVAQFEVADGEADDRRLVELAGDGRRQRQQFRQLVELVVLLAAPRTSRVARLLLAKLQNAAQPPERLVRVSPQRPHRRGGYTLGPGGHMPHKSWLALSPKN